MTTAIDNTWNSAGTAEKFFDAQPDVDSAVSRLRAAIELEKAAQAQKAEALEEIKALVADDSITPDEGKAGTYSLAGVRITRSTRPKKVVSTKAKERLNELEGDLRMEGLITETTSEVWTTKLV